MPSGSFTASAGVHSKEAVFRTAVKLALGRREADEVTPMPESLPNDQVAWFIKIIKDAQTVAEETGSPYPPGIYKKER